MTSAETKIPRRMLPGEIEIRGYGQSDGAASPSGNAFFRGFPRYSFLRDLFRFLVNRGAGDASGLSSVGYVRGAGGRDFLIRRRTPRPVVNPDATEERRRLRLPVIVQAVLFHDGPHSLEKAKIVFFDFCSPFPLPLQFFELAGDMAALGRWSEVDSR